MKFEEKYKVLLQSRFRVMQVVHNESIRLRSITNGICKKTKRDWFVWDIVEGLRKFDTEEKQYVNANPDGEPISAMEILNIIGGWFGDDLFKNAKDPVIILEDYYPFLRSEDYHYIRRLRKISTSSEKISVVLSVPHPIVPKELEKEMAMIELPLPTVVEIGAIYRKICKDYDIEQAENYHKLLHASLGLSTMEIQQAYSKAAIMKGKLSDEQVSFLISEKEEVIRKSGYLEYYHPNEQFSDVGGLDILKKWLDNRSMAFTKEAQEFGLESPRGILLLGIPGTGKSLAAKAIGNAWQLPLLKLDFGRVFGSLVGESEKNMRSVIAMAEALAPSILWVDEIEKGLAGSGSSGNTDGGTTARVMGTFLNWMQERKKPVFIASTANDVSKLPPELLRKGRVDEVFFVDLPGQKAREDIFNIHLKRRKKEISKTGVTRLSKVAINFSGAEIEEVVKSAMFMAFDKKDTLKEKYLLKSIESTVPLAVTMSENIKKLREWSKKRAVYASSEVGEDIVIGKRGTVALKQEMFDDIFVDLSVDNKRIPKGHN